MKSSFNTMNICQHKKYYIKTGGKYFSDSARDPQAIYFSGEIGILCVF